jgi:hypothetical protein
MATRSRPAFVPTEKQRGQVEAMAGYGIPEQAIADKFGIAKNTLRKHFEAELKTGATTANSIVGEFLFATISGKNDFKDNPGRIAAAMFWAKTRMGWKETAVIEHKDLDASNARERVARRLDRIAAAIEKSGLPPKAE